MTATWINDYDELDELPIGARIKDGKLTATKTEDGWYYGKGVGYWLPMNLPFRRLS